MKANDLLSAALRHMRDAERLAQETPLSLDQARHLAGFGPECARKALLDPRQSLREPLRKALNQAIAHDFSGKEEPMVAWALAMNPEARELPSQLWHQRYPSLKEWSPECRYHRSGYEYKVDLTTLLADARKAVDEATAALWLQGIRCGDG